MMAINVTKIRRYVLYTTISSHSKFK